MRTLFGIVVLILFCSGIPALANVFDLGSGLINLELVPVGDACNQADTRYTGTHYGSVGYNYQISKFEITAAQYTDFLNNKAKSDPYGLYDSIMVDNPYGCKIARSGFSGNYSYSVDSSHANRPVNCVDYWDACRFANWLHNGQANGDMENGAYTLHFYTGSDGHTIERSPGAKFFLPSEDEWYKSAYYKGGNSNAGYWTYPTQSDTTPSNQVINPDPGNNAIFGIYSSALTVGTFENSESAYGTFDQGGNVEEWTEGLSGTSARVLRGGSVIQMSTVMAANFRYSDPPSTEAPANGIRVAYMPAGWQPVPEPSSLLALAGGLGLLVGLRRRRV